MSQSSYLNSPLLLGFDQLERAIDRMHKTSGDGYPPYNVEQVDERHLRITLAVAGFSEDDLEVRLEKNQLTIRGRQAEDDSERTFLHRGIAARQFQRSFMLADGMEVEGARLDNGLLHIELKRQTDDEVVRTIKIERKQTADGSDSRTIDQKSA
ncbi:Hsp20 family protein [Fodinicurvata sediminis]|uniref:Hsp20 family protein n=1 Tax=Fodinicurvata sediminis TaxID=1121832 RepID=UPI0003B3D53C|nr:Hsp20 family protein [Fodinicurvata sediminis]